MADSDINSFHDRFLLALEHANLSPQDRGALSSIARLLDVSHQTVRKWLNGDLIPMRRINEIGKQLKVNPTWLLTGQGNINPLSTTLFSPGVNAPMEQNSHLWQKIPIISWEEAGAWHDKSFMPVENTRYIWSTTETSCPHFALTVRDDLMEPRFYLGDTLIFDPSFSPVHKNRILLKWSLTQEVVCGILIVDGKDRFIKPHNPLYEPRSLNDESKYKIVAVCRQVFVKEI